MEIKPPQFKESSYNCQTCNAFSHMEWNRLCSKDGKYQLHIATCTNCSTDSVWRTELNNLNAIIQSTMIFPKSNIAVFAHEDMPVDVKANFNEARDVYSTSAKAAAALLRLALQKLCIHLGEPGKNINTDIKSLVEKGILNAGITKAADTVRIIGNNAVHPGILNDEDIDSIALKLFDLINFIVRKTITEPRELEELYNTTPETAREAVIRRDTPTVA